MGKPSSPTRISDVFKSVGQPTVTYVRRTKGNFEKILRSAILSSGQLCLVTGPSKTGKTTLYRRVLEDLGRQPLVVRCDKSLGASEFWAQALESINFSRLKEMHEAGKLAVEGKAKVGAKIGWGWLASLIGEASLGVSSESSEAEVKERILSKPSPLHLIPVLKKLPVCLVVEDFHYLDAPTKEIIFQQWKSFVDEDVSVIVLGKTHHAIDIVAANKDLLARVCHVEISRWNSEDLESIVQMGLDHLKIGIRQSSKKLIASESVGLPILTQHCCEQLFTDKSCFEYDGSSEFDFTPEEVQRALANLAQHKYSQLESYYTRLITGPRKRARTYNTYELILSCFAQEPIKYSLRRHEIEDRLSALQLPAKERPPAASVTSTLNALARFQTRVGIELLEWHSEEDTLHILEPLFLFYLRWRGFRQIQERQQNNTARVTIKWSSDVWKKLLDISLQDSVQLALFDEKRLSLNKRLLEHFRALNIKVDDSNPAQAGRKSDERKE